MSGIRPESRAKFERLGLDFVRQRFGMGNFDGAENVEAQRWMVEADRKQRREQRVMLWLTFIAAVGAVIAAVPVVWGWLR
jgi:hypothetical protein